MRDLPSEGSLGYWFKVIGCFIALQLESLPLDAETVPQPQCLRPISASRSSKTQPSVHSPPLENPTPRTGPAFLPSSPSCWTKSSSTEAEATSNHYQTLDVSRDASGRDVIRAYHALALQHHPDRPSGSTQAFQHLSSAFEVLGDEAKRQAYNFALVERANRDGISSDSMGLRPTVTGEEAHVLADYPASFAKLLLSAKPALWGRLLKGLSRKQLDELKACLLSAESGKPKRLLEKKSENLEQLRGLDNLSQKGGYGYVARVDLSHLEVFSPYASSVAVAAYYHSAVLELRNRVKGHTVASPRTTFEEAVLFGMASLDEGMACPLTFRARVGRSCATLPVDDVGLVGSSNENSPAGCPFA